MYTATTVRTSSSIMGGRCLLFFQVSGNRKPKGSARRRWPRRHQLSRENLRVGRSPKRNGWLLGAHHYLTIGDPPLDPPSGATDVTSVYTNLLLAGPRSRDVLSKLTSLRLSDDALPTGGGCAQASVAHAHGTILREDFPQLPAYHLLISREYAESVWESILHAGHECHMRPFGLKALELLRA